MSASHQQILTSLDVIQKFYPRVIKLSTEQLGTIINKAAGSIRNDISEKKFQIPHHKDSAATSAKLWFHVLDVAEHLDRERNPVKLGRKTKASKFAAAAELEASQ